MADIDTLVDTYIAMWNETDPDRRRALVAETVSDDADYVDPLMEGSGVEGIATMIGAAQSQFPGHRFALVAGPEAHHDRVRFSWSLAADGSTPVAIGTDVASLSGDGRMRSITGFLEPAA
jgi:hypothetical protein